MCDPSWDDDAEEELQFIEAVYTASKRRRSDPDVSGNEDSSSTQRRRLPGWAYAFPPSESTARVIRDGNNNLSSRFDGSFGLTSTNGLCALSPSPCLAKLTMKLPAFTFGGRTVYSRTTAEVEKATTEIHDRIGCLKHDPNNGIVFLGFDVEWKPIFKRGEKPRKTAVLQICVDSFNCYVMHIIHSGIPTVLKSLLEDPSIRKVGIGIANDARKISGEYDISVASLEDLSSYANIKLGGAPKNWGLCSLTEMLTCKKLLKPNKIRMGNWEAYALSKEQINYAATDAFASWYLYQVLKSFPDPKPEN